MRNIHLLPTDKPSRLFKHNELGFKLLAPVSHEIGQYNGSNQHIYITSDEEIKEGDWVITNNGLLAKVVTELTWHFINSKKIILTTDQDLIKDGIQQIDNDFLEWFVSNPSCENVEVVKDRVFRLDEFNQREFYNQYKIIIPKEEPKQERVCNCGLKESEHNVRHPFIPRQETLEEFPIHNFMSIEPTNKKQQKELESNRIKLGIKNKEEDFVLKCLLSFDWRREVILCEVEKVSFTGNMIEFRVRVKAPYKTVDYCCSNPFKESGWSLERLDFNSRAWEVWSQLNRYLKR